MRAATTYWILLFVTATRASSLGWWPSLAGIPDYIHHHLVERATVSASYGTVIYPPAAWFSIYNLTGLADISNVMVNRMQTWYQPDQRPNYEWTQDWQIPLLGMALADLDLSFGNSGNEAIIRNILALNGQDNYVYDQYVDDARKFFLWLPLEEDGGPNRHTLSDNRLNLAGINDQSHDGTCGGGLRWITYDYTQKNTVTNMLQFSIITRLYRITGYQQYLTDAMTLLDWWLGWALDTDTCGIWDTIELAACTPQALQVLTYNSGVVLFGLADLYVATGNITLLNLGRSIAYAAMHSYTTAGTGILQEGCEHNTDTTGGPPGCSADAVAYKGILVLGMAELYTARPDPNIFAFVNTQLLSVLWHNLDETWLAGEWWPGPWNETTAGPKTQITAICLLAAAAIINSNFLTHAGRNATGGVSLVSKASVSNINHTVAGIVESVPVATPVAASSFARGTFSKQEMLEWRKIGIVITAGAVGFGSIWI